MFQPNQIVTFVSPGDYLFPFHDGETVLFLGEIPNMPGHCAVVTWKDGKVHWGYHTEDFREPTEAEL